MIVAAFSDFMQQVVFGLASGGIYALLALALVIIHRSTGVINFAQGEMATLSTYIAWTLTVNHGWSYWPAFVATLAISFGGGVGIHRVVIRPVERGSVLRIVIVTIGLLVAINGFVIWQWGGEQQMLALGRALMSRPRLLLLDEPSLGLAPMVVREFFRIVRELNEKEGLTVLVVEQDARIALAASRRAYVLEVGRVALTGTSHELRDDEAIRRSYLGY